MKWVVGITTVPSRQYELLPKTIESIEKAGFDIDRLFVDGDRDLTRWEDVFQIPTTTRWPIIRVYANWMLGLAELYARDPFADRFIMFQDDIECCKNLRIYLEQNSWPLQGYANLCTYTRNLRGQLQNGWQESLQRGLGAQGLVFTNEAVRQLFQQSHITDKPRKSGMRSWKSLDGGIVQCFRQCQWKEYVHYPSLINHVGQVTTCGNLPQPKVAYFLGADYDPAIKESIRL